MIQEGIEPRSDNKSETEGARRATCLPPRQAGVSDLKADPEVPARLQRHRYTENYKKEVITKVSELRQSGSGEIGSYLRKEGIYYSMVLNWEKKFKQENGISVREKNSKEALEQKVKTLEKELKRTKKKLEKSELIIEFQKKISQILSLDEE